jgi:aminoglycoside/choline kinase family phosphotransferase
MRGVDPAVTVERVDILDVKRCGEGVASTADRVTVELGYSTTGLSEPPTRLVLKTVLLTARAPEAMYENEVRFYAEVRPHLDIETPRVFGHTFDPKRGRFAILLEDLSTAGARFPSSPDSLSPAQANSLVELFAGLHGSMWQSSRLETELSWVPTHLEGGMADVFSLIGHELISDQIARHPQKQTYIDRLGRSFDELWELLGVAQRLLAAQPQTLLHGDPHLGNTYTVDGDRTGLLDWQLVTRGCWAHDVTYALTTGLDEAARREHFERLLARYLQLIDEQGVADVPSLDDAKILCRAAALWGFVIGWLITPPDNYGWEITAANLDRVSQAAVDFETVALLEQFASEFSP